MGRSLSRSTIVWAALLASMTVGGGTLLVLDEPSFARSTDRVLAFPNGPQVGPLEAIWRTRSELDRQRWTHIVIHHSGASHGSAQTITEQHKRRGFQGLGYQFVIGNGRGSADGSLHIGYRWLDQLPGAHTGGPDADYLNRYAIGICLIGDGDRKPPTTAQMHRLIDLVRSLQAELGISSGQVVFHSDVANTSSPGRFFPGAEFRERLDVR
ncbi:MAG: N-acetylmuramoyl-L-alanine amidase [Phycisphaerales bacterium]|nr:N-acetylmuramoyl-L-alanine amidase [Phycisphaerales bacterium]